MSKTLAKRLGAAQRRIAMLEKENRYLSESLRRRAGELRELRRELETREEILGILAEAAPGGELQLNVGEILEGQGKYQLLCEIRREASEGKAVLAVRRIRLRSDFVESAKLS